MMHHPSPFSPIALVGFITLLVAYAVAAWCVAAGIAGNARKNRRLVNSSVYGLYGFSALVVFACSLVVYAMLTHDYAIKYVAKSSDSTMSTVYKITALWGGLDGSLLFWVLVLALFSTVAIVINHRRHRDMIGFVVATIMIVQVFFLSLLIFNKNPFATFLTTPPIDGDGLNPALQNYWMVIHPPSLYTGFVAATIPFAFGIGALASGRLDDRWLSSVRVWMLICFGFLSLGLVLGGRWAYEMLGWGGYWAWDPVECAGLIPWFTATAFLHSSIIQEQRGTMKTWNLALVVLTFFLTIFGTFMTRSGVVQSVHAFGQDNILALEFIVFMAVILVVSIGLIVYRSNQLSSKTQLESFWSREYAFLVNNWILLACAFFVLFATMFPTISQAVDGSRVSVGPVFFDKWMAPFALVLLLLAGAAPLLAWRRTTRQRLWSQFAFPTALAAFTIVVLPIVLPKTRHLSSVFAPNLKLPIALVNFGIVAFVVGSIAQEFWRGALVRKRQTGSDAFTSLVGLVLAKRRKYGGYIVHLGVAVMFVGFAGQAYNHMIDRTIVKPAPATAHGTGPASFSFDEYTFTYERLIHTSDDHKDAVTAQMGIFHDGQRIDTVYPAKWDYHKADSQLISQVAITPRYNPVHWDELGAGDVYIVLTGYNLDSGLANFRVYINPMIAWVWLGFLVLAFGTLVCLIPQGLVDRLQWKPRSRLGRAADVSIVLSIALALVAGLATQAHAASAPAEHIPAGMGMGDVSAGWAAKYRPNSPTAEKLMKELLCNCNCPRLSLYDCDCGHAAEMRQEVLEMLAATDKTGKPLYDLSTDAGRQHAYHAVLAAFVAEYGGSVLATPKSKVSWLFPSLAALGGLVLIGGVGRRWVARGTPSASPAPPTTSTEDDSYADKLDDELAETD